MVQMAERMPPEDRPRAHAEGAAGASGDGAAVTRMDAHCHSSASSGPAVRALGLIGCPECYSPPEAVYEQALRRGMDLVTITDHDTIDGALSLVERGFPRVVIGEEVTVRFPEDRCKLHVLVWGLTPGLHEEIGALRLRDDVYAFAGWLRDRTLAHSLAHPLYVQNHKLTRWHLDRCVLLFKAFETLNGAHAGTHKGALETYLGSMTPGKVHRIIREHGLEPLWPRIWEKGITGGSDDHGLLNVGRAWTQVTAADAAACHVETVHGKVTDPRDFLKVVMNARSASGGSGGHSALLAHQLTTVGARYYAERMLPKASPTGKCVASKMLRFAGVDAPRPSKARLALHLIKGKLRGRRRRLGPLLASLRPAFAEVLAKYPDLRGQLDPAAWSAGSALSSHDRMADFANDLHAALHAAMASGAVRALRAKDRKGIVDHLLSYLVLELSQLPYLFSLFHQNKERTFVEHLEHESAEPGSGVSVLERPMRVMLFTDTLGDVNGVSRFIRNAGEQAQATGRDLSIVTSTNFEVPGQPNIHNFAPVFATAMPKYENLELVLPPLVKMLRFADARQPDVIHVSTPGPVGLVGLIAARMLRIPIVGVYHTDFPAYVEHLFKDDTLTRVTEGAMRLFYAPFRTLFTRSADYIPSLEKLGIDRAKVLPLLPGIMTEQFHPRFREGGAAEGAWAAAGSPAGRARVLYVGRVSVEKNLPHLAAVWRKADATLRAMGVDAELCVIGDGPYRAEMERELKGCRVRFLGFRYGEELSRLYAGADLFAFPSRTDTLGQVVMESQASGLPVVVTDEGGPKEVVTDGVTGYVVAADDLGGWADRLVDLASNPERRRLMGAAAHAAMQPYSMAGSFEHYWGVHERAWVENLASKGITARSEAQAARGASVITPSRPGVGRWRRQTATDGVGTP